MTATPCIDLVKMSGGVLSLRYFGREIGLISRVRVGTPARPHYRAVSVRGDVWHAPSLKSARAFLMGRAT